MWENGGPIATLARCPCGQIADVDTEYTYPRVRGRSAEVPRPQQPHEDARG
jgi:hypothetical protein